MESINSKYQLSFLVSKYFKEGRWILYNWLNTEYIAISDIQHPLYKILESKNSDNFLPYMVNDSYFEFEYLIDKYFFTSKQENIRLIVEEKYRVANSEKKLHLILMVVNQACNFDCLYCYEDHTKKQRMGEYEIDILINLINKSHLKEIGIDYFGGEPLLNADFLINFNQKLIEINKEKNRNFTSSITTNGYLLKIDLFKKLLKSNISNYQITIDGIEEDHNNLRPLKNGKATYSTVFNNLKAISKLSYKFNFTITLRINFNTKTATELKRNLILTELKKNFGNDKRFCIYPHSIDNWKLENIENDIYIDNKQADEIYNKYEEEIITHGFNPFSIINYGYSESHSCFADKSNSFVVYPAALSVNKRDLALQKCTIALSNPKNNVGFITETSEITLNQNFHHWVKGTPFKKEECKTCFFVLNCYGSVCPLNTINNNNVTCPKEKKQEIELTQKIVNYIENN